MKLVALSLALIALVCWPLADSQAKSSKRSPGANSQQLIKQAAELCRKKYPGSIVYPMVNVKKRSVVCYIR